MARNFRFKDLQLSQLRGFCWVATEGSFAMAAKEMGLSSSAVWQQVRALERHLGVTLMRRHGRSVELTAEGRLLLELIQPQVGALDSLGRVFAAQCADLPKQLAVTSTVYLLAYHLDRPIRQFTSKQESVRLDLRAGKLNEIVRPVERGEADLGILPRDRDKPVSPHLDYEHLFDLPLLLLTSEDHPLIRRKKIEPSDLIDHPMILSSHGTHARKAFETILRRHDIPIEHIHIVMESNDIELMLRYVRMGVGVAVRYLSNAAIRKLPGLRQRRFGSSGQDLSVELVTQRGAHLSQPARDFRQLVVRALSPRKTKR